jgi:pyridoxamine 5'-phosphate oxidase
MQDFLNAIRNDHHNFSKGELERLAADINPFDFFGAWFKESIDSGAVEPNAMVIATVSDSGQPSTRIVYLKEFLEEGLVFYTNYNSQKGIEIGENPKVALHFFWSNLERQVRIEGLAEKAPAALSDKYFESRPKGSQIGAWASDQSRELHDRKDLVLKAELMEKEFGGTIPRPEHWGGYVVKPTRYEFWQGRPNRLHDRICFDKEEKGWRVFRKNP